MKPISLIESKISTKILSTFQHSFKARCKVLEMHFNEEEANSVFGFFSEIN